MSAIASLGLAHAVPPLLHEIASGLDGIGNPGANGHSSGWAALRPLRAVIRRKRLCDKSLNGHTLQRRSDLNLKSMHVTPLGVKETK